MSLNEKLSARDLEELHDELRDAEEAYDSNMMMVRMAEANGDTLGANKFRAFSQGFLDQANRIRRKLGLPEEQSENNTEKTQVSKTGSKENLSPEEVGRLKKELEDLEKDYDANMMMVRMAEAEGDQEDLQAFTGFAQGFLDQANRIRRKLGLPEEQSGNKKPKQEDPRAKINTTLGLDTQDTQLGFCPSCGKPNEGGNFCPYCGTPNTGKKRAESQEKNHRLSVSSKNSITVNGRKIDVPSGGYKSLQIINGKVIIDGVEQK